MNRIFRRKLLLVLATALLFVFLGLFAYAQGRNLEVKYPGSGAPTTTNTPLSVYLEYIFHYSMIIAGVIALGVFVVGGVRYLISAGNPAVIDDARDQIFSGFLGLVILLSSYLLLNTINPDLVNIGEPKIVKTEISPEKPAPPPKKKVYTMTFFQIPVGKIIERAALDDNSEKNVKQIASAVKDIENESSHLKNLTHQLRQLTDACKCGNSSCSPKGCYGGSPDCPESPGCVIQENCKVKGCPNVYCDKDAIKNKIKEIQKVIKQIKTTREKIAQPNIYLSDRLAEIQRAVILMGLESNQLSSYSEMNLSKLSIEKDGFEKVNYDSFDGWKDNIISIKNEKTVDPFTLYFPERYEKKAIDFARSYEPISIPPSNIESMEDSSNMEENSDLYDSSLPGNVLNIPYYSQRDPRWRSQHMGAPGCFYDHTNIECTIGSVGCTLTSISSVLKYFGFNYTPLTTFRKAKSLGLINDNAYLNVKQFLNYISSEEGFSYNKIRNVKNIIGKKPIITYCPSFRAKYGHWISVKGISNGYVYINDPYWGIKRIPLNLFEDWGCGSSGYYVFWRG